MIPRFRVHLSYRDLLTAPFDQSGQEAQFEADFARTFGFSQAVWFPYARTAIRGYLECLDSRGKRVVLSPYNCVALAQGVTAAGAIPLYVDTQGFNQDPAHFRRATQEAHVGVVVGLWGSDVSPETTEGVTCPILYDYALRGLAPDTPKLRAEDGVVYSLSWGKPLSMIRGAVLCGNSAERATRWREWRDSHRLKLRWWQQWRKGLLMKVFSEPTLFGLAIQAQDLKITQGLLGRDVVNSSMGEEYFRSGSPWHFSLGIKRLAKLEQLRAERKAILERYRDRLKGFDGEIELPEGNSLSHFALRVASEKRDELHRFLLRYGIFTSHRLYEKLLSDYPAFRGETTGELVRAREQVRTTLHLPLYFGMGFTTVDRVADAVKEWVTKSARISTLGDCFGFASH